MVKKKKKVKKPEIHIDEVETAELNEKNLIPVVIKINQEIEEERQQRDFFLIERDKISKFWEISRNKLEKLKNDLRNREREQEEEHEKTEESRHLQLQQSRHTKLEQIEDLSLLRIESQTTLRLAEDRIARQEGQLLDDIRDLQDKIKEREISAQEELRKVKMESAKVLYKKREEFDQDVNEFVDGAEEKLNKDFNELEKKILATVEELTVLKNHQISQLIESNDEAFKELRVYYNGIIINNLAQLDVLKKRMEELQQIRERSEKAANDALTAKNTLVDKIEKCKQEMIEFKKKIQEGEKIKVELRKVTKDLIHFEKVYDKIKWRCEVTEQRYEDTLARRDELKEKLTKAILELQCKTAMKNVFNENCSKLKSL